MKNILLILSIITVCCFTANAQGWNIDLKHNWTDATMPASLAHGNAYNEVWGVTINGAEIAIFGSSRGTHFFDITDPDNVVEVDFVIGADTGNIIVHRDYHDYQNYLYAVSDEGLSTLQIMDLSYLPDSVSLVYDSDTLFNRIHNIFIDSSSGLLYGASVSKFGPPRFSAMEVYSLANPINPLPVDTLISASIGHVHDVYARDNLAYLNAGTDGLFIYDYTSASNPTLLGSLTTYPDQGYNHSGWLSEDGNYYVFADETHGTKLKICDVSDPTDIQVVSTFGTGIDPESIAHNLLIKDSLIYVSYYYDGLRVYDFSDPSNPFQVAYYETSTLSHRNRYEGNWGLYPYFSGSKVIASDMQTGFWLFEVANTFDTNPPTSVSQIDNGNTIDAWMAKSQQLVLETNLAASDNLSINLYSIDGKLLHTQMVSTSAGVQKKSVQIKDNMPAGVILLEITGENVQHYQQLSNIH